MHALALPCCGGQRDRWCRTCGGGLAPRLGVARCAGELWACNAWARRESWAPTLREAGARTRLVASGQPVEVWRWLAEACLEAARRQWDRQGSRGDPMAIPP